MLSSLRENPACLNPSHFPPPSCSGSKLNVRMPRVLLPLSKTNEKMWPPGSEALSGTAPWQLQSLRPCTYAPACHGAPILPTSREHRLRERIWLPPSAGLCADHLAICEALRRNNSCLPSPFQRQWCQTALTVHTSSGITFPQTPQLRFLFPFLLSQPLWSVPATVSKKNLWCFSWQMQPGTHSQQTAQ